MNRIHQNLYKAFGLVVLAFLIYSNSFHVPFQFDDAVVIVNNPAVHQWPDAGATWKAAFHFQASRVLSLLTFAFNYGLHRLDVVGYHLVNLLIHIAAGFAVWWLGELLLVLFNRPPQKGSPSRRPVKKGGSYSSSQISEWRSHLPLAAALLFLAHPVNTEAVTYISQRCESMAALFYILSVCCYLSGRMATKGWEMWYFAGSIACGLLAMFSKETAISLPLAIVSAELFFFGPKKFPWPLVGLCVAGLVIVPSLFHFDWRILTVAHQSQSHLGDVLTWPAYVLTELRVFVVYLRLLFVPLQLNLDYDFPMSHSLFEPAALASLALLAGLLAAALRWRSRSPALAWAVVWFFIALSANLIPRTHVIFEHKLYLVTAGVIPALCLALGQMSFDRRRIGIGFALLLAVFSFLTYERNKIWQSQTSLWHDSLAKSPRKGRVYLALGAAYAAEKRYDKAIDYLTQAITFMHDPQVFSTRAMVYVLMKNDDAALLDFNEAISRSPEIIDPYVGRGELWARRGHFRAAAADFNKAIMLNPAKSAGYKMRGRLNEALQRSHAAIADYSRAIALDPGDAQTLAWRGYMYALEGKPDLAAIDFERAVRLDPNLAEGYVYRAMLRKDAGRPDEAMADFKKALSIKPSAIAYYQRGQLLLQLNRMDEALEDANQAIKLDDKYDLAYGLRARLLAEKRRFKEAIDDLTRAIAVNPNYTDGYLNRGFLRTVLGQQEEALDDYSRAIALNPTAPSPYRRRARIYATLKKYDLAIADFSKLIELEPKTVTNYVHRAELYKTVGDLERAALDAEKAKTLGYTFPPDFLQGTKGKPHDHSHR